MPRIKSPESYPVYFTEFVKKAGLEGERIRVPEIGALPDDEHTTGLEKALKIRGLFYAYIGSLKRERAAGNEKWIELANYADQTVFFVNRDQCCIEIYPRSESWQNKVLATGGVVDGERTLPASSPAAESLKRLQEQLRDDFIEKEKP